MTSTQKINQLKNFQDIYFSRLLIQNYFKILEQKIDKKFKCFVTFNTV